jgi:hypothetical protein
MMKPKHLIALFLSVCIGIGLIWIVRSAESMKESSLISPVSLDYSCNEPKTSNNFEEFWPKFRAAVESDNREELFLLIDKCRFIWDDRGGSDLPLKSEEEIRASLNFQPPPARAINSPLVFETQDDFSRSYHLIFSPSNKKRILAFQPKKVSDGFYEISWREDGLRSLFFRQLDGIGYKFSGLLWEP